MNGSARKSGITGLAIVALLAGVVFVAGCGGSDDSGSDPNAAGNSAFASNGGGMFAELTDDQRQCLEEAGVTLPDEGDAPQGDMPQGEPPAGMTPPDGAPQGGPPGTTGPTSSQPGPPQGAPRGIDELQSAMEDCGIDMPEPPDGSQAPGGDQGGQGSDGSAVETKAS